jgi:hypothetical protein
MCSTRLSTTSEQLSTLSRPLGEAVAQVLAFAPMGLMDEQAA